MSKVGTPTDKEERYLDFGLETAEDVPALLDEYVYCFKIQQDF